MSIDLQIAIGVIAAVLVSVIGGAIYRLDHPTLNKLFWADRLLGALEAKHLFISSSLSLSNGVLFFLWLGYKAGLGAVWIQLVWCAGFLLLGRYASRIRTDLGPRTLHGLLGESTHKRVVYLAVVTSGIGIMLIVGWELNAIISLLTLVSRDITFHLTALIILAFVVSFYTGIGGIAGNAKINRAQNFFSCLAILALLWFILPHVTISRADVTAALNPFARSLSATLGLGGLLTIYLNSVFWQLVDISSWQTLQSESEAVRPSDSVYSSVPWILVFPGVTCTLLGVGLQRHPDLTAASVIPAVLEATAGHFFAAMFVALGLTCAAFSTIDGYVLAMTQSVVLDVFRRSDVASDGNKTAKETLPQQAIPAAPSAPLTTQAIYETDRNANLVRGLVLLLTVAGALAVFLLTRFTYIDMFEITFFAYSLQICFLPAVVCLLLGRGQSGAFFYSILVGVVVQLGLFGASFWFSAVSVGCVPAVGLAVSLLYLVGHMTVSRSSVREV